MKLKTNRNRWELIDWKTIGERVKNKEIKFKLLSLLIIHTQQTPTRSNLPERMGEMKKESAGNVLILLS